MSELVTHYAHLKDRITLGSFSITTDQYPFAAFTIGYLAAATALPIELLFQLVEVLNQLAKSQLFSQNNVKQMLKLLLDFPADAERILQFLKALLNGAKEDLVYFIESCYRGQPPPQKKEPVAPPPANDINNEGTMELQDVFQQDMDKYEEENRRREQQDIELARRMQEQFDQEKPSGGDEQEIHCEICCVNLFEGVVQTLECGHMFHKQCLAQTFRISISNKSFPLRCPSEDCQADVSQGDIRAILSKQLMQKYQQHTLKAYAEQHGDSISWCPTANCGYMFFHQKDDIQRFECLECKKEYCLNCRVEWHKDMTCKEYKVSSTTSEDDQKFMAFVKGKKFKQCPKCKFWVEKNEGCDHMTCKCKFQFCYKCGGVYMKCECADKARIEMENRRRAMEERKLKKTDKKKVAQQRAEKKLAERQKREEEKRQREEKSRSKRSKR